ncbi:hypothetical protein NMY22_g8244 [Coprinellus aureogranulatus]|nr:hypothetical protein NMY22_g8244 [Coprinellus aureogranulatus]
MAAHSPADFGIVLHPQDQQAPGQIQVPARAQTPASANSSASRPNGAQFVPPTLLVLNPIQTNSEMTETVPTSGIRLRSGLRLRAGARGRRVQRGSAGPSLGRRPHLLASTSIRDSDERPLVRSSNSAAGISSTPSHSVNPRTRSSQNSPRSSSPLSSLPDHLRTPSNDSNPDNL